MNQASLTRPSWIPEELFPFESRYLDLDGHRLHYVDEGEGPVLLMLHGNPTWSFLYRRLIVRLRVRFRCIAVDYPGFGLSRARPGFDYRAASQAQVVRAFVEELDLTEVIAMGQDWGGPIMFSVASKHPERFAGFVVGNTWAWPLKGDPHFELFARVLGGGLGGWAIRKFNAFVNVMLPLGVRATRLSKEVMNAYRGPFPTDKERLATHVFPRELVAATGFLLELESELSKLRHLPVMIVWGKRDFALRRRERERFERIFYQHETVLLERAGHFIQEDAPDEIADAILRWWPPRGVQVSTEPKTWADGAKCSSLGAVR